jgi:hypothetical protein
LVAVLHSVPLRVVPVLRVKVRVGQGEAAEGVSNLLLQPLVNAEGEFLAEFGRQQRVLPEMLSVVPQRGGSAVTANHREVSGDARHSF